MIENVFTGLTLALDKSAGIALAASFAWGILSILLSPCHLASVPLIVAFVGSQGEETGVKKAFLLSFLFSTGILITIAALGVITTAAGMIAGDLGIWGNIIVAVIFAVIGLHLLGLLPLPFLNSASQPGYGRKGYWAAFILGLVFGIALGPCTFAFMAPVLAVAFKEGTRNVAYSSVLVLLYAIGHCSVIVVAGTFTEVVEKYLHWSENSKSVIILKRICGVLLVLAAFYLVKRII